MLIDTSTYVRTITTTNSHLDSSIIVDASTGGITIGAYDMLKIDPSIGDPSLRDPMIYRRDTHLYVDQKLIEIFNNSNPYEELYAKLRQAAKNFKGE